MSVNKITNSKKTVSPKKSERLPTRVSPRKKIVKTVYDLDIASGSGVKSSAKKRISTYPWNEERIQEMIQGVSEYPVLYDISRDDYKDVTVHARALDAVAQRLPCCTGADVKSKWEYLRKCWLNERREQNKEDPSGTGTDDLKKNQRKPFAYYESMGFISPFTKSRVGRHTNITNNKYFQTDDYGNENDADEAVQQQQTVEVVHVELSLDSSNSVFASEQTKQILQNGTFYSSDSDQFADERNNSGIENGFAGEFFDVETSLQSGCSSPLLIRSPSKSTKHAAGGSNKTSGNYKSCAGKEANQPASATKKMIKGKNTMQDIDGQLNFLGKSMMALVESKPENPQLDDTQKDWYSYAANFGIRVAAIPCDDARDQIRLGMENLYATYKKWKPSV
ncbi:uncharacterized protein LOC123471209 [Daphnia magna]|uniref:uncharacterized protein LOC123471209 n=1 Tax=Daphnia magna TaxID=35525 RepID=UPI001E1BD02C|nr:uncharacterized protein LOC123471209 [Daphnia magna]